MPHVCYRLEIGRLDKLKCKLGSIAQKSNHKRGIFRFERRILV